MGLEIGKKTGKIFVSGDIQGFLKLWNLEKETCRTIKAHNKDQNFVRISPNEKMICSGGHDKTFVIFNSELQEIKRIKAHKRGIWDG